MTLRERPHYPALAMDAQAATPILNVSDMTESFAWFERIGWRKLWDWGEPPGFGAVGSGKVEIFLCHDGQGGRGLGSNKRTFSEELETDRGCWMSIWVTDVDAIHKACVENDIDITMPPGNMPWGVREMHIRHPDGHVFASAREPIANPRGKKHLWAFLSNLFAIKNAHSKWLRQR